MKIIELPTGEKVKCDDADYVWLSKLKWHAHRSGEKRLSKNTYVARSKWVDGSSKTIRMHREIMDCPKDMEVDHKDGDCFNNQRSNLEIVTKAENVKRRWTGKRKVDQ